MLTQGAPEMAKRLYKIADDGGDSSLISCPTVLGEEGDNLTVIVQGYELDGETTGVLSIQAARPLSGSRAMCW